MELEISNEKETGAGSYFVANYPPFSTWGPSHVPAVLDMLGKADDRRQAVPLGLYMHIPFCRKRCKFCYFRVYTDKNSSDVETYLDALSREIALYAETEISSGRDFEFVYFGGGTPSFLSEKQLTSLIQRISKHWRWEKAREVTFECEPGTLKKPKLEAIRSIGTTRLSLGVEHFDDNVLSINGRAHKSPEIFQAYEWARNVGFPQINIDLIAGMLGDDDQKWQNAVEQTITLDPDSVTIYQLELPFNTEFVRGDEHGDEAAFATWPVKRRRVNDAFDRLIDAGYRVSSGYTLVKPDRNGGFVYRDSLWHGADMIGTGVASFSHAAGFHFQNLDQWEAYVESLGSDKLPVARALPVTDLQRMIREFILQLKVGEVRFDYFVNKFGIDPRSRYEQVFEAMQRASLAKLHDDRISLTRDGMLRVDGLLPEFFEPQYRKVRYT